MRWSNPAGDALLADIESRGIAPAVASLRAARATNPKVDSIPAFAFSVAGEKLVAKQRVSDAIALYEAITTLRPNSMILRAQLGEAYLKGGQMDKAIAMFREVAASDSTNTGVSEWLRILSAR